MWHRDRDVRTRRSSTVARHSRTFSPVVREMSALDEYAPGRQKGTAERGVGAQPPAWGHINANERGSWDHGGVVYKGSKSLYETAPAEGLYTHRSLQPHTHPTAAYPQPSSHRTGSYEASKGLHEAGLAPRLPARHESERKRFVEGLRQQAQ